ncbi:MAG: TIGR04282 family arsenosugar biosynthesis glycosyltransferase [Nitrosomonadales bacterium]|nr:TIGR04282 family arsenosugar biosynthesis glycosyltransferase [Nitrosomonadales bacterium]
MTRIIIFAKAPQPGFAKTRLIPALGQDGAAKLARQMLFNTLHEAVAAEAGQVELCVTPDIHEAAWRGIQLAAGIEVSGQGGGDLGARLARAARRGLAHGEPVLLIGTDCVEMSAPLLRSAAAALEHKDAVIHPAADGGYALLGLARFHMLLFENMAWSSDRVASETIGRIGKLGWSLEMGAPLHDIDGPGDLGRVPPNWL